MSFEMIGYILLGVAAFAYVSFRQLAWQTVNLGKLMRMPAVMFIVGLFVASRTWTPALLSSISGLDVVIIGLEVVVAVIGGRVMGSLSEIATIQGRTSSRLRPVGLAIWFGFVAVRVGFDVVAGALHAELAASSTLILFMLAVVKGVQAITMYARVTRHEATARSSAAVGSRF